MKAFVLSSAIRFRHHLRCISVIFILTLLLHSGSIYTIEEHVFFLWFYLQAASGVPHSACSSRLASLSLNVSFSTSTARFLRGSSVAAFSDYVAIMPYLVTPLPRWRYTWILEIWLTIQEALVCPHNILTKYRRRITRAVAVVPPSGDFELSQHTKLLLL